MDGTDTKQVLEAKLAQCRRLAREFSDGVTAKNIAEFTAQLEQQIRDLEK
jgi:hypothetical protein